MAEPPQVVAARGFVRDLNIVLKLAALYGLDHTRATSQFELTWSGLRRVLEGHTSLIIGAIGDRMVINDQSVKPSTAERAFVSLLSATGIASIEFQHHATRDELATLIRVLAAAKPGQLWATLQQQAAGSLNGVRVHEFRLTGNGTSNSDNANSVTVPAGLATSVFGQQDLQSLLNDPVALLKMAISSNGAGGMRTQAEAPAEEQVISMVRAFARIAQRGPSIPADITHSPEESDAMYQYLMANGFGRRATPEAMLKIAESLTIRAALEKYESGDVQVNAVRQMLQRFSQELETLRAALKSQNDAMTRAGLQAEPYLEALDRQFWDNLPDSAKLKVLLSPDAWCIPGNHAAGFIGHLLQRGELQTAHKILDRYCSALRSNDPEAKQKAAAAIAALAGAIADAGQLAPTIQQATIAVTREREPALRQALISCVAQLAREAEARHDFEPLRIAWACANAASDEDATAIRSAIVVSDRVHDLFAEALNTPTPPSGLIELLRHSPRASVDAAIELFDGCQTTECRERLVRLVTTLGDAINQELRERFAREQSEALNVIGLLARVDQPLLTRALREKIRSWSRADQDTAVRQVAASGAADRGTLLLSLLDVLDRYIAPLALDEIGMTRSALSIDKLMEIARGDGRAQDSPFLQVKAIECLTRLEEPSAVPVLMNIVTSRKLFGHEFPTELRVAALQGLLKIVPEVGRKLQAASRLNPREVGIAPLPPSTNVIFLRQRRFPRMTPRRAVFAAATDSNVRCPLTVESLSMVGGAASASGSTRIHGEADLELQLGFRRVRAHVTMRQKGPYRVGFEVCDMPLDDRYRLRQFLAS